MPTWDPSVPSPTPIREFHIVSKEWVCKPQETPLIEVVLQDERGRGIGGAEVWLVWDSGADRAITGLKAERGVGFVDFEAVVGQSYALSIGQLGLPLVTDLEIAPCPFHAGAGASYGTWQITLQLRPVQTAIPTSPSSD